MNNKGSLLFLFLSVGTVFLGSYAKAEQKPRANDQILVTSIFIPKGFVLNDFNTYWVDWSKDFVPGTAIMRSACPDAIRLLSGYRARSDYEQNEVVQSSKLEPGGFACNSNLGS